MQVARKKHKSIQNLAKREDKMRPKKVPIVTERQKEFFGVELEKIIPLFNYPGL